MKKVFILFLLALLPIGMAAYTLGRVSVHDPSIVWDQNSSSYYIFGSHRGAAKTTDLMNWTAFTAPWGTSSSVDAANAEAFTTNQITSITIGEVVKNFGPFNAYAYSAAIATSSIDGNSWGSIDGNMWAPDVIWNPNMEKWCMYLSLNGIQWNSSVILLTADNIEGPYTYQGPIVFSGFNVTDNEATSYKNTDLELVLGEQASLPDRYNKGNSWGTYWPHCIDPCVFFDADNNLWLTYGSWSGGIYILRLNKNTGLRDYDYTYELSYSDNSKEETVLSDPYFGKKIAGGCYVSGEASYIERIGNYYYLFMSYGFYDSVGGYQMRVFRSSNPDGPYTDPQNGEGAAIFSSYRMNYGSTANTSRGEYIFGAYGDWGNVAKGATSERSQGHNSIIAADDGRTYLVYHTKFQNWAESHQVRIHQVFQNEDGWLVAAPFEYTGETVTSADIASTRQIATDDIPGLYKLLVHREKLNHTIKEMVTPVEIELKSDKTITGEYTGSWTLPEGTNSYINITLGSTTYKGVMIEQTMEPGNDKVIAFTAMSSSNGINIWGHKFTPESDEPITSGYDITTGLQAYYNFDASPIANSENNEQVATLQQEGTNTVPVLQTDAERTGKVLHTMFGASGNTSNAKFANPLYNQILDVGATLAFWVNPIEVNFWDALFGFQNSEGGRLYMTGNNYVGYNSGGWIDLNHPNSVTTGDITFGHWNFVTVTFSRTEGPKVYVDGVHKPFQTNGNGDANQDYNDMMVNFIQSCPDFYFGYGSWWGSANALFDELLFYNRVLTETDVKALYQKETEDGKFKEVAVDPNYIPEPVYFNDFSSTAGLTQVGSGEFIEDADSRFGKIYHNNPANNKDARTNYLKLPADVLKHSRFTKEMTIGFWVNVKSAQGENFFHCPVFSAYASSTPGTANGSPMFRCSAKGVMQLNNGDGNWTDFTASENDKRTNTESTVWLDDADWHYYTVTLTSNTGTIYVDGVAVNSWTLAEGIVPAFFSTAAANGYPVVCLGGNQSWDWNDFDAGFGYDDIAIYNSALTAEQIAKIISTKKTVEPVNVPTPVYFNDFSSTTGLTQVGSGEFIDDADPHFGKVYHNDPNNTSAVRTNYLKLPSDVLSHSATTKEMTIGFWVNKRNEDTYFYTPLFAAYGAAPGTDGNTWPMFVSQTRGLIQVNCAGYCDFGVGLNDSGVQFESSTWLDDGNWHYYTVTLTSTKAKVYVDGELKNGWTVDDTSDGQKISGLFTNGSDLNYITLGGNQAWEWQDPDPAFAFDDFAVYDKALTAEQIAQIISDKNSGETPVLTYGYTVNASYGGKTKALAAGTGENGASITVAYPRYILDGTTLYEAAATSSKYSKTFTLSSLGQEETITYNVSTTQNVYYYAEAENVLSGATSDLTAASNGKLGGRQKNSSLYTSLVTLPAGTWQIATSVYVGNSGNHTVNFKVDDEVKWTFTRDANSGWYTATSEQIVLPSAAVVSVAVDGGGTTGIDWIYIKSANDIQVVGATDYTTGYRSVQSSNYNMKKGDKKVINFRNFGKYPGENWNNWVMVVKEGEIEKSITRADFYDVISAKNLDAKMSTDGGNNKVDVDWNKFKEDMADALVEATVTYGVDGNLAINAVATGAKNGYMYYVENSIDELTDDLTINLSVDHSWLEIISVEQTAVGVTTTAAGMGFATLYTDKALDFSSAEGLNAYTATLSDKTVTLTKVADIKAGTGVVLKSDKTDQDIIYSIPVISDSETVGGDLKGNATEDTPYNAFDGYDLYMLAINASDEAQFIKVKSGSVAAGKAYLKVPSSVAARALSIDYSDGSTGIHAVENTGDADGQIYSVSGQRVAKPGKGLYIVNGKKVIFK